MQINSFLAAAILASVVVAVPTPNEALTPTTSVASGIAKRGDNPSVNQLITDAEWAQLEALGPEKRGENPSVNRPITDAEWANLEAIGSQKRSEDALAPRDKTLNCGHKVTGKGGSNGHGKWIPVESFKKLAHEFCDAYQGTDVAKGHETSDTYPTSFSNGKSGYVVFAVYNQKQERTWTWNAKTCYNAMIGPLGSHAKRGVDGPEDQLVKRDNCYGKKNHDYEGGYYFVDGIGAFGSEVYPN